MMLSFLVLGSAILMQSILTIPQASACLYRLDAVHTRSAMPSERATISGIRDGRVFGCDDGFFSLCFICRGSSPFLCETVGSVSASDILLYCSSDFALLFGMPSEASAEEDGGELGDFETCFSDGLA